MPQQRRQQRDRRHHEGAGDPTAAADRTAAVDPEVGADPRAVRYWRWRDQVAGASGLNFLLGTWLIGSPFALVYGDGDAVWNPIASGVVLAAVALVRVSGAYRQSWLSGVNVLVGAWLFASAFWLTDAPAAAWNSMICGAGAMALALWSFSASETGRALDGSPSMN